MKKKILIIEDDSLIIRLYETRLKLEGFAVISAQDGEEGIKQFDTQQPDLVVLDLMLPKISGLEVLQHIRQQNKSTPILVYTVLSDRKTIDEVRAKGASEYLAKPDTHPRKLVERIKSYLI